MKVNVPQGLPREEMPNALYDFERAGRVMTGDITQQQEEAYFIAQDRNARLCVILAILFGVAFLYSLFGMWRP